MKIRIHVPLQSVTVCFSCQTVKLPTEKVITFYFLVFIFVTNLTLIPTIVNCQEINDNYFQSSWINFTLKMNIFVLNSISVIM